MSNDIADLLPELNNNGVKPTYYMSYAKINEDINITIDFSTFDVRNDIRNQRKNCDVLFEGCINKAIINEENILSLDANIIFRRFSFIAMLKQYHTLKQIEEMFKKGDVYNLKYVRKSQRSYYLIGIKKLNDGE